MVPMRATMRLVTPAVSRFRGLPEGPVRPVIQGGEAVVKHVDFGFPAHGTCNGQPTRLMRLDLPEPVAPMKATVWHWPEAHMLQDIFCGVGVAEGCVPIPPRPPGRARPHLKRYRLDELGLMPAPPAPRCRIQRPGAR